MSMLLLCYTRHIMQKPVHKLQLLVFALTTLHITFSTKARHFRVRGRYVLDKVKRLDPYKNHHFRLLANTIHAFLMASLYKSLQNKTN